jgi:putative endonuclease
MFLGSELATIPGLRRTITLRFMLRRARETRLCVKRYFVYILCNRPRGVLYVGVTNDLARRAWEHKTKVVPGFTSKYGVTVLVYYEEFASILEARDRERAVKHWRRAWKFKLIEAVNPDWRDLYDDLIML